MPWMTQSSFATGEVDPSMVARTDLAKMSMAALTLRNRTVLPHGPSEVRPGFEFIYPAKYADKSAVLRPFVFSLGQNYVLEFGDYYIRFYKDDGVIVKTADDTAAWVTGTAYAAYDYATSGTTIYRCTSAHTSGATTEPGAGADWAAKWVADDVYEIASPYSEADLYELNQTQSGDLLYLTHRRHPIMVLSRSGHSSWAMDSFEFEGGPFLPENLTDVTLACSAKTGTGKTLTASAALFEAGHVGSIWKMTQVIAAQAVSGTFTSAATSAAVRGKGTWRITTHGTWTAKIYLERSLDGVTWEAYAAYSGAADNNLIDEEASDGLYSYRLNCYSYTSGTLTYDLVMDGHEWEGVVQVTGVTDSTHATVSVIGELASTAATKVWAEGAWSDVRGWPSCSLFYQNRFGLAGTPTQPEMVHLSKTDDYGNFALGTDDDSAIALPLVSRQSNMINAMVAKKQIIAFTASSEFIIDANGGVMTPTTPVATEQESNGIGTLDPLAVAGNRVVFVAPQGDVVLDIGYNLADDAFIAKQLSILAPHLFRGRTLIDACYQKAPESICWFVRDDGVLLGLTYLRDQEVWAWHRHDTDGKFLSVCSIRGARRNELWALIERGNHRYVERLAASAPTQDPADQFYLDSGLTYTGTPITTVTGLSHLEGKTVSVNADGFTSFGHVITGGQITLPTAASKIHVGLPYVADLELPDADFTSQDGTVQGRKKRLDAVILRLQNARGGKTGLVLSDTPGKMDPIPQALQATFGTPIPLYNGDVECSIPADVDTTARVCVRQTEPMPLTVLAVIRGVTLCD